MLGSGFVAEFYMLGLADVNGHEVVANYSRSRKRAKGFAERWRIPDSYTDIDKLTARDDIDLFFFHQANLRINQYVAQQIGLSEDKLVSNIQRYGNTTAATIPILLAEAEQSGRLKRGMKVAMVAFGSGFTWGAAIADW